MKPTAFIYHPDYRHHETGMWHPENSGRLDTVLADLQNDALAQQLSWYRPDPASLEDIRRVHDNAYIRMVEEACLMGNSALDKGDTQISYDSFSVALLASGSARLAVDLVCTGEVRNAFSAMRPPGHHATSNEAMGFCLFNHVAVVARYAQAVHGVGKVAILDWDVHHGNGTQAIFYEDPSVLFVSLHQYPFYPGTGASSEIGSGAGVGANLNVPLPEGSDGKVYRAAMTDKVLPALESFAPELILVSAGFDAHALDPMGGMKLEVDDFNWMASQVKDFSERCCGGRWVSVLEGGYHPRALSECVRGQLKVMLEA